MYEEFYHFKENPFNVTSDPVFFFSSNCHSLAFSHLTYGIEHRKGILLITGEVGTGKTTLCRTLLDKYRNHKEYNVKTALILNPSFSDQQLLQLILRDFGIQGDFENKFDLVNALNEFLLEETGKGNNIVLLIDEAQNLGVEQLEQIRLLSNLETEKDKLLQIVLIGQPELCAKLELASLRQLNQRIAVRYHIRPLKREEVKKYISHRLRIVSSKSSANSVRFTNEAIDVIYESCKGTPRMINIICDRALLAGYTQETFIIGTKIINRCIKEVDIKISGESHNVQIPHNDFEPGELIVDLTKKRRVWYKNIYVLVFIFFAVAGPIYTALDFYGITTLPKPPDQNFSVLPNATERPGLLAQKNVVSSEALNKPVLPEQKIIVPSNESDEPVLSVRESASPPDVEDESGLQTQKSIISPKALDKSVLPEQKIMVLSNESDEPVLPVRESVVQSNVTDKSGLSEQKEIVLPKASDKSVLLTQKKSVSRGFRLLKPSSRYVETEAGQYSKGSSYYDQGEYREASVWFRKAAEQGHAQAQSNLGVMYSEGLGVEEDYYEAVKWCRKAAEQGYAQAQTNMCIMYSEGKGVEQDYKEAFKWCRKAAEQENGQAQAILGIMYYQGKGVDQNVEEAVRWYKEASEQGIDYAKEVLRNLEVRELSD